MKTHVLAEKSHEHADPQRTRSTDPEELEADRAATAVLSGQKASVGAGDMPPGAGLGGSGQPLPPDVRREMEAAFGRRFSDVRVHADERAGQLADSHDATAFTMGRDIVFGPGAFAPRTDAGRRLIAHELAHVAQGAAGPLVRRQAKPKPTVTGPGSASDPVMGIRLDKAAKRVVFVTRSGAEIEGTVDFDDIASGTYMMTLDRKNKKWKIDGTPSGLRFDVDLGTNGDPWSMSYPQRFPLEVGRAAMGSQDAFETLHKALQQEINRMAEAVKDIPNRYTIFEGINHLRDRVLPMLQWMLEHAGKLSRAALAENDDTARAAAMAKAGAAYQAVLAAITAEQLEINLFMVAGYADQAGAPSGAIIAALEQFAKAMAPLAEALRTEDPQKIAKAMQDARPVFQKAQAALHKGIENIKDGAALSKKVIAAADILMIAINIYQVWKIPTMPGVGGGGGSASAPAIGQVFAGGTATAVVSAERLREMVEALNKLIAIGALDKSILGSVGAVAGSKTAPIPELGEPTVMQSSGSGPGAGGPSASSGGAAAKPAGPKSGTEVVQEGSGPLTPGRSQLGEYGIDTYESFNYKGSKQFPGRTGDKLAGHEMLQNIWLERHGYGPRLSSDASKHNPAVGLSQAEHAEVGRQQVKLGLDGPGVAKMTAAQNIELNAQAMRRAGIREDVIQQLKAAALKYAAELKPPGGTP
jgi:hypothetical protein